MREELQLIIVFREETQLSGLMGLLGLINVFSKGTTTRYAKKQALGRVIFFSAET